MRMIWTLVIYIGNAWIRDPLINAITCLRDSFIGLVRFAYLDVT